jgi:tetratricopeptide (TPR) repeat protein
LAGWLAGGQAAGQLPPKHVPHDGYWLCFQAYLDGEFRGALRDFRSAAQGGFASPEGRWIDSICFYTMMGECHYQMGDLAAALAQYESALKLFLVHRDWMNRIDFPANLKPDTNAGKTIAWGPSTRRAVKGQFPDRFQSLQGRLDNENVIRSGGVIANPQLLPVNVAEIVRCTTLAMSRRREIAGPSCEHDRLTTDLVEALSRRPGPPNHWAQCWIELQLGVAYASANKPDQATSELTRSLLAGGMYDHPLTCIGLLELGRLAFEQGKYDAAMTYCHESTLSAAAFERYDVMEDAFRIGAQAHSVAGKQGINPPLSAAALAAKNIPMLQVSLLTSLAEQNCTAGQMPAAQAAINQAQKAAARRDLLQGAIGARMNYQSARIMLQTGEVKAGGAALASALAYQSTGSLGLFQIALADSLFAKGNFTERIADLVYAEVLREPTRTDWLVDPLDTLAVLLKPHPLSFERWLEVALVRKETEKALNIADRLRRHRFFASQALGGRLLALRWVLEGPPEALTKDAILQRQDLLVRYPKFAELSKRVAEIRTQLQALPLVTTTEDQRRQQSGLLAELASASAAQEGLLQMMALERVPSELAFPPLRETKDIQAELPAGTLVFDYLITTRHVHAFAITKERIGYFTVSQPAKLKTDLGEMLRQMGHHDRTQPVPADDLLANGWRTAATRLVGQLTNNTQQADWAQYRELVIVPDGILWYLPFETLPVPLEGGATSPLLLQIPIRYAPTLSLVAPDRRKNRPVARAAVVAGKLLARDDDAFAKAGVDAIAAALPGSVVLNGDLPATSATLSAAFDRLVVMRDCEDPERLPFGWSPLALDAGKPGSSLADWGLLPFTGTEQVVFPGFHTPAEFGLKRPANGEEVFLTVCGLMAAGSRTILLSRWRVGGQSTVDLMREFVQELPHDSAAKAWQRSVRLAADRQLDPSLEGRLKASGGVNGLKAEHPFFWSGYLLVDTGLVPPPQIPAKAAAAR